jgi:hypothetical protein
MKQRRAAHLQLLHALQFLTLLAKGNTQHSLTGGGGI